MNTARANENKQKMQDELPPIGSHEVGVRRNVALDLTLKLSGAGHIQ